MTKARQKTAEVDCQLNGYEKRMTKKRLQILNGAQTVFMRQGFEGASVDAIAAEAGVSKATLYNHFPDKRLLFKAVVDDKLRSQAAVIFAFDEHPDQVEATLFEVALQILDLILSPFARSIFRMSVGEVDRFPEFAKDFYQACPQMGRKRLVAYLEMAESAGAVRIEDKIIAAEQFIELCRVDLFYRNIFGLQSRFSQSEKDKIASEAVKTFMARFGTH